MRYLFLSLVSVCILLVACNKGNEPGHLTGDWELETVIDKSTSSTLIAPAGIKIRFSANTGFTGNTLRNTFAGKYTLTDPDGISFNYFESTKVAEDNWGTALSTVLMACMLQSVSPCTPSRYELQARTLKIKTVLRYDITLRKI